MKVVLNLELGTYFLDLKPMHLERLMKTFPKIEFVAVKNDDPRFADEVRDADVLATRPFGADRFAETVRQAEKLRWVQFSYVGVAPGYLEAAKQKSFVVTNARGLASESVALHALSLILAFERKLSLAFQFQHDRHWDPRTFSETEFGFDGLRGKTLGIVGLGSIGIALAEKAVALGMRVRGIKRSIGRPSPFVEKVLPLHELPELLSVSDFVVLSIPFFEEARELIGKSEFAMMKKNAFLVNIARGKLVDEDALVKALNDRVIAGAALDVVADEPLPPESPLWTTPNLILTPHIAVLDRRYTDSLVDLFEENLREFLAGKPLKNQVNLTLGY